MQLDMSGNFIPPCDQRYIWISHIIDKLHRIVNPIQVIPSGLHDNPLQDVISGIQQLTGDNLYSGIILLGMLHYEVA